MRQPGQSTTRTGDVQNRHFLPSKIYCDACPGCRKKCHVSWLSPVLVFACPGFRVLDVLKNKHLGQVLKKI